MSNKKSFPLNLFQKPAEDGEIDWEACREAASNFTPADLRAIAMQYRDDLIDELARLDAFIDWADLVVSGDASNDVADLCVLTKNGNVHALH